MAKRGSNGGQSADAYASLMFKRSRERARVGQIVLLLALEKPRCSKCPRR